MPTSAPRVARPWIAATFACAVLVALGWYLLRPSPHGPAVLTPEPRGVASAHAHADPPSEGRRAVGELSTPQDDSGAEWTPEGLTTVAAPDQDSAADAGSGSYAITGRLVSQGLPLSGGRVRALLRRNTDEQRFEVTSAGDGRFAIHGDWIPDVWLQIIVDGPGLAQIDFWEQSLPSGDGFELGDLEIEPGMMLSGRVLDSSGVPVQGAVVRLERLSPANAPNPRRRTRNVAHPREDGTYRLYFQIPADRWRVTVSGRGLAGVAEAELDGRAGGEFELDFVIEPLQAVSGRVVGPDGEPVGGLQLLLVGRESGEPASLAVGSRPDGEFRLRTAPGWDPLVPLDLVARPGNSPYSFDPRPVSLGDEDVVVVARRAPVRRVRVLDAVDGRPLQTLSLRQASRRVLGGELRAIQAPDGLFELSAPAHQELWITLLPPEPWAPLGPVEVPLADDVLELLVPRARRVEIEVVRADGTPLPDVPVVWFVVEEGAGPVAVSRLELDAHSQGLIRHWAAWSLQRGHTDSEGRARMTRPALDGYEDFVRALPEGGIPIVRPVPAGVDAVRLELEPGGSLEVVLAGRWPPGMRIELLVPGANGPSASLRLGDVAEPLLLPDAPAGRWVAAASARNLTLPLLAFEVMPGKQHQIELDFEVLFAEPRQVTLRRAGQPFEPAGLPEQDQQTGDTASLRLLHLGPDGPALAFTGEAPGGRLELGELPRGAYLVELPGEGRSVQLDASQWAALDWDLD